MRGARKWVYHALKKIAGRAEALCGTMKGIPREWPNGHDWANDDEVTCPKCLAILKAQQERGKNGGN